jgi:hypothetical protein
LAEETAVVALNFLRSCRENFKSIRDKAPSLVS